MTRIHAFFVSFKNKTWPKQQLTSAWKVFIMIQKVEGADRLYRDAFLGILRSEYTNAMTSDMSSRMSI